MPANAGIDRFYFAPRNFTYRPASAPQLNFLQLLQALAGISSGNIIENLVDR